MNKWIPRFSIKKSDGGKDSGVNGYLFFEWKPVCSFGLLRFSKGTRPSFHSHAFFAITWWLKGSVEEETYKGEIKKFTPSFRPKITKKNKIHRVKGLEVTWAFTIRGPWENRWIEIDEQDNKTTLTNGRKVVTDQLF
jgi:hypothetical protein